MNWRFDVAWERRGTGHQPRGVAEFFPKCNTQRALDGRREGGGRRALDKVVNSLDYGTLVLVLVLTLILTLTPRARSLRSLCSRLPSPLGGGITSQ